MEKGDFSVVRVYTVAELDRLVGSRSSDTFAVLLCGMGTFGLRINNAVHPVEGKSVVFKGPVEKCNVEMMQGADVNVRLVILTQEFMRSLNFDLNVLGSVSFSPSDSPVIELDEEGEKLLDGYVDLMEENLAKNKEAVYVNSISRNLFAAMIYQIIQIASSRQSFIKSIPDGRVSHSHAYVRRFLELLRGHYMERRGVDYYAGEMCLSPKYLSKLVKEVTGHSAAEWIDHIVVLEAKNLLRYSGKNVQQVAYALGFNTQSAFGKYFKHFTGMSPTEFQRS